MRLLLLCVLFLGFASSSLAQVKIWRCTNSYTNDAKEAEEKNCKLVEGGNVTQLQGTRITRRPPTEEENRQFRESLKVGVYSADGLVVEVKPPVVKVQTRTGERWFRIDELQAPWVKVNQAKKR